MKTKYYTYFFKICFTILFLIHINNVNANNNNNVNNNKKSNHAINIFMENMIDKAVMLYRNMVGKISPGFVLTDKYILSERFQSINSFGAAIDAPSVSNENNNNNNIATSINNFFSNFNSFYKIYNRINRGHNGEVWHATYNDTKQRKNNCGKYCLVIKRFFIEKDPLIKFSGFREIYFGKKLTRLLSSSEEKESTISSKNKNNNNYIVKYVDHMLMYSNGARHQGNKDDKADQTNTNYQKIEEDEQHKIIDLWIVFENAGKSLTYILYEEYSSLILPSRFWKRLRTYEGNVVLREIVQQLLKAVKQIHSVNIVHRDIKPSNIMIDNNGKLKLADFGSAVDLETIHYSNNKYIPEYLNLYPATGPSQDEETKEYMPPEVRLSNSIPFARFGTRNAIKGAKQYDMWSIGIVLLELLLVNDNPLAIDSRTEHLIRSRLKRQGIVDEETLNRVFFLRGLMEWGIYDPNEMKIVKSKSEPPSSAIVPASNINIPEVPLQSPLSSLPLLSIAMPDTLPLGSLIIAESISPKLNSLVEVIKDIELYDPSLAVTLNDDINDKQCRENPTNNNDNNNNKDVIQKIQEGINGKGNDHKYAQDNDDINNNDKNFNKFLKKLQESDPIENNNMKDFLTNDIASYKFGGAGFLWRLLQLNPDDRMTIDQAITHSFLRASGPYKCERTGKLFELPEELKLHCPDVERKKKDDSHVDSVASADIINDDKDDINNNDRKMKQFTCPTCGRKFDMWQSCNAHMIARKHHHLPEQDDKEREHHQHSERFFCTFDPSIVPDCEIQKGFGHQHHHSWHRSGTGTFDVCGIRGRRLYMEDYFGVDAMTILTKKGDNTGNTNPINIDMYGVFDGHLGTHTVKYLVKNLFPNLKNKIIENCFDDAHEVILATDTNDNDFDDHTSCIGISIKKTFKEIDISLLHSLKSKRIELNDNSNNNNNNAEDNPFSTAADIANDNGMKSGSTATIMIRTDDLNDMQNDIVTIASVGDSRGILCCNKNGSYVTMSKDHKPDDPLEKERIETNGGYIEKRGVWRVNGKLAISRSFGDIELKEKKLLNAIPSIRSTVCKKQQTELYNSRYDDDDHGVECLFIILGTDGVWDVISNEEAIAVVKLSLKQYGPNSNNMNRHIFSQNASSALTHEVYVRDSRDNIGVMIIAMW